MRISDRYIGKQVLLGTLYAILVLSVVLILGNLFKEIRPLLVEKQAPLLLVLRFVINVLPSSLMYTVPWGFLSAVLLVFGRLSSDQEITSFRVAGVSLPRLSAPVFVIGAALSALSLWININVMPNSKANMYQLIYEQASTDPESLLKPGIVQGDFDNSGGKSVKVLIEGKEDGWVKGFHFYNFPSADDTSGQREYIHAQKASLSVDHVNNQLRLKLNGALTEWRNRDGTVGMILARNAEPLLIDLKDPKQRRIRRSEMTNDEIREYLARETDLSVKKRVNFRAEITKRYSFSMACLAFACIAIPLGLKSRRRDTSGGLVISMLLGAGYFLFTVLADEFETDLGATVALWSPNVLCILLGFFLFRRARFK